MEKQTKSYRSAFIEEQKTHVDTVLEEAQRLVNLYRHADSFGEDFKVQLDQMLLSAPMEVQTALSDILGGQVVRQYCAYLKERVAPEQPANQKSDEKKSVIQQGYLPSPEEANATIGGNAGNVEGMLKEFFEAHQQALKELLKVQSENLTNILGRVNQNTHEMALNQTDRLINAIQQEKGKQKKYADVIEAGVQTPVLVPDETEGF